MTTISLEKQAVSPRDGMVFCPLRYTDVHVELCLGCDRLVRSDESIPPRYVICDARMLERSDRTREQARPARPPRARP